MARLRWAVAAALMFGAGAAVAQDAPPEPRPADFAPIDAAVSDGLFAASELDALLAPIALYPDALLTQILVAATFPLDVVRADRWTRANAGLAPEARAAAAEAEGWDPSVAALAAGFPEVVQGMAADLDGTEALGEAMLAQTDDVLDAVQRLRGQAQGSGALASNAAQTVSVDAGAIAIAPTDPEVVYVPTYDPGVVYAAAPTGVVYGDGNGTGDLLATGAIAFGSALLIDEIFDDDDDWNRYWDDDDVHIDWDDGDVFARPDRDIDVDGDVTFNRNRVEIDRDRIEVDSARLDGARDRLGGVDPDGPRRPGAWTPDPGKRDAALAKLNARQRAGDGALQPAGQALRAGSGDVRAKIEASSARRGDAPVRTNAHPTAFKPQGASPAKIHAARERGAKSAAAPRGKPAAVRREAIGKPKAAKAPARKPSAKASAFKKPKGGGNRAKSASARGKKSSGGRRR